MAEGRAAHGETPVQTTFAGVRSYKFRELQIELLLCGEVDRGILLDTAAKLCEYLDLDLLPPHVGTGWDQISDPHQGPCPVVVPYPYRL